MKSINAKGGGSFFHCQPKCTISPFLLVSLLKMANIMLHVIHNLTLVLHDNVYGHGCNNEWLFCFLSFKLTL